MKQGARILVVEDDSLLAMLIQDMLSDLGYEIVGVASTLSEGKQMAAGMAFDIAILDVSLHGEKAFPIAQLLEDRQIPFVFSSGYAQEDMEPEYSGRPLLRKPYQLDELEQILAALA